MAALQTQLSTGGMPLPGAIQPLARVPAQAAAPSAAAPSALSQLPSLDGVVSAPLTSQIPVSSSPYQQALATGNTAGAAGIALGAGLKGAAQGLASPFVAINNAANVVDDHVNAAADAVHRFAGGLFGTTPPPAVPQQVATVPASSPAVPSGTAPIPDAARGLFNYDRRLGPSPAQAQAINAYEATRPPTVSGGLPVARAPVAQVASPAAAAPQLSPRDQLFLEVARNTPRNQLAQLFDSYQRGGLTQQQTRTAATKNDTDAAYLKSLADARDAALVVRRNETANDASYLDRVSAAHANYAKAIQAHISPAAALANQQIGVTYGDQ